MVVVPTFNERDNIESLVSMLLALPERLQVLVVDDNSPDGTGLVVEGLAAAEPRVHSLRRPAKLGLGTAHKAGLAFGLANGFDTLLTMDADFSHHPRFVSSLLIASNVHDVVVGSRYVKGGSVRGCSLHRRVLSWGANFFAAFALRLPARDCTAGFRCYSRDILERVDLSTVVADGYSFLIEALFRLHRGHASIGEVPITFEDRRFGTSKISRSEVRRAFQTVLRLATGP